MNDLRLTELLISMETELRMLERLKRDNKLDTCFLVGLNVRKQIDLFMDRLNEIRWPPK